MAILAVPFGSPDLAIDKEALKKGQMKKFHCKKSHWKERHAEKIAFGKKAVGNAL